MRATCDQDVFQEGDKKQVPRKRKHSVNPELVTIHVNGQEAECLMQGKRPTKSDLVTPLVPQRIEAVLDYIAQDASQALGTKRAYRKREAVPKGNAKDQEEDQGED